MFRSKNTKFKIQSITLNTIVIPHQENTNVSVLPTYRNFLGGTLVLPFHIKVYIDNPEQTLGWLPSCFEIYNVTFVVCM